MVICRAYFCGMAQVMEKTPQANGGPEQKLYQQKILTPAI
jgi:hypothetical protein